MSGIKKTALRTSWIRRTQANRLETGAVGGGVFPKMNSFDQ